MQNVGVTGGNRELCFINGAAERIRHGAHRAWMVGTVDG
jgi:hypothetical protein